MESLNLEKLKKNCIDYKLIKNNTILYFSLNFFYDYFAKNIWNDM